MLSNRVRATSVALAVIAGVVGSGVLTAAAQDTTATPVAPTTSDSTTAQSQQTQPPQGPARGFGRGMMFGLDLGADGNLADSPIIIAVADALKLDAATLVTDLQSGKSVTDLATEQKVDIQTVYDAVTAKYKQLLDAEVGTGYLTQAQADTRLATFTDNIAKFPLFAQVRFPNPADTQGQGFGPQGGFPGGRGNGGPGFGPGNGGPGFGPGNGPQGGFGPGNGGMNGNGMWGNHHGGRGPWGNQQNGQPNAPTDPNAPANPTTPQTSPATPEATQAASA